MRARTAPLFLALLLMIPAPAAVAAPPEEATLTANGSLDATGRYIAVLDDGVDVAALQARHERRHGLRVDQVFDRQVHGFAGKMTGAQVKALRADPDVASVVPDEVIQVAAQTIPTGVSRIGTKSSAMAKIDGIDQRVDADVAIVDTGIDKAHPDLNVAGGYNCTSSTRTAWGDGHGHGTHVAGTVGAKDNASGVVGVAPGVRLWAVRILNSDGFGYLSWYVCGLDWITAQREPGDASRPFFEAVNMSVAKWGRDDGNCGYSNNDVLHQGICRLVASGVTVAVAGGNDGSSAAARVPAAYNEVITVSALADSDGREGGLGGNRCYSWGTYDIDDTFADFSNHGADIDIIAPGKCIWSTLPGSAYGYSSGTSMATPAVTGAIALYKATRPWVKPGDVKGALQYLGSTNWKQSTDPDSYHERLLMVSKLGPAGDFGVALGDAGVVGEAGGTAQVPVTLSRTATHFESVQLAVTGPKALGVSLDVDRLMGFTAKAAVLTITVPTSTAPGQYEVTVTATEGPRIRTATTTLVVEGDLPTAFAPVVAPAYKLALTGDTMAPVRITWPAATDPTSAIDRYEMEYSMDGGPWTAAGGTTATSTTRMVDLGHSHRFRIRAADVYGNWSPWVPGAPLKLIAVQDNAGPMRYAPAWSRSTSAYASAGTLAWSTRAGASVSLSTTARTLALVAPVSSARGQARIYVDDVLQATVSLYSPVGVSRRVLWVKTMPATGYKTLRIEVVGTAGRPRIDVDAVLLGW
jgi:subtilisin